MKPMETVTNLMGKAKRCFVSVEGTEFWIKVTKSEVRELKSHLGGWHRLDLDAHGDPAEPDVYVTVRR